MEATGTPLGGSGCHVHQALIRPAMFLWADRVLVSYLYMVVGCFVLALPWTAISLSVSAIMVLVGHPGLILLCKYDPDWRRVVMRHVTYQMVYPAAAHPTAPRPRILPSVPTLQECH